MWSYGLHYFDLQKEEKAHENKEQSLFRAHIIKLSRCMKHARGD